LYRGTTWNRQESVSLTEPSRNWTGAPRSPQRTWAENDMFRLLLLFDFAKAMVGFAHLIRPTYALANVGHPSSSYWVLLGTDSAG
jgi:hypothetical protein